MGAMMQIFRFRLSAGARSLRAAVLLVCLMVTALGFASSRGDSLLNVLDRELAQVGELTGNKEQYIGGLRKRLNSAVSDSQRFDISRELYREYRYFQYDSALSYANRMLRLAKSPSLAAADYETLSRIALMECYTSVGLFKEADDMFSQIRGREIPREIRIPYISFAPSITAISPRLPARAISLAARFPLIDDHEKAVVHSQAGRSYFSAGDEEKPLHATTSPSTTMSR